MMAEIRIEHVPLSELCEMFAPNNPKEHDVGAIVESVRRFGFASPVVLDDGAHQLAEGHGRIEALARMKAASEPPPERIERMADGDWSVPVVRGIRFASEQEADAYRIAANQTTILGGWDDVKLIEVLRELSEFDGGLRGTGYGEEDLGKLLAESNKTTEDEWANAIDLPKGEKSLFENMTFTVTVEQGEEIRAALAKAKSVAPFIDTGNENSNGNALARIAENYNGRS